VRLQRTLAVVLLAELLLSIVLVVRMAVSSPINAHPDEMLHVLAADYFREHWLPPAVGAPAQAAAYSKYGVSYLDFGEIVYWVLGKAAAVGGLFGTTPPASMRAFQVLLYAVLVVWILVRATTFPPALGFLVLTPQVWYVFSYVNSDALPLALLTGLLLELGWPESGMRAFLRGGRARPTAGVFAVGGLLGLLVVSKLNYLVSLAFVGGILVWRARDTTHWRRLAIPVMVAVAIAVPWFFYHAWINDFETGTRAVEYAEKVAAPDLKPSTYASPNSFPYIALRAKGVPLWTLLTRLDWPGLSFRSFSGLYGWMSIAAVPWVYRVFGVLDVALLAILVLPVAVRGPRSARLLLLGVLACAALVIAQSLHRSWTFDFQAQGRYLFPILPMLFFYWRRCEEQALRAPALLVAASLGALSLFSFALIGLANLT
jgi:hypothetical protein